MDPQSDQWRLIAEGFPVTYPPDYEMLAVSLSSRLQLAAVPVAVLRVDPPLIRFALPGGTVPNSRVMPRAGPILARNRVSVRVTQVQDGEFVLDANFEQEMVEVDFVDATPAALTSFWRPMDDFEGFTGFRAFGPDDTEGSASLPVWPYLQDLLDISNTIVGRPAVAYEPDELADIFAGSPVGSWDVVGGQDDAFITGASAYDAAAPAHVAGAPAAS